VLRIDLEQIKYVPRWVILFIRNLVPTDNIVQALAFIQCAKQILSKTQVTPISQINLNAGLEGAWAGKFSGRASAKAVAALNFLEFFAYFLFQDKK